MPVVDRKVLRGLRRFQLKYLAVIGLLAGSTGCAALPPALMQKCLPSLRQPVSVSTAGTRASTTFDVLTFNVEGLGWPAREKRGPALEQIRVALRQMEARGDSPDVVMVQEMLSKAAVRAVTGTGYPNMVFGPSRTQRKSLPGAARMGGPYRWKKGELGLHMVGSGLAILSGIRSWRRDRNRSAAGGAPVWTASATRACCTPA